MNVPVTLKIRTGWDSSSRNGVAIARLAEQCGIQAELWPKMYLINALAGASQTKHSTMKKNCSCPIRITCSSITLSELS